MTIPRPPCSVDLWCGRKHDASAWIPGVSSVRSFLSQSLISWSSPHPPQASCLPPTCVQSLVLLWFHRSQMMHQVFGFWLLSVVRTSGWLLNPLHQLYSLFWVVMPPFLRFLKSRKEFLSLRFFLDRLASKYTRSNPSPILLSEFSSTSGIKLDLTMLNPIQSKIAALFMSGWKSRIKNPADHIGMLLNPPFLISTDRWILPCLSAKFLSESQMILARDLCSPDWGTLINLPYRAQILSLWVLHIALLLGFLLFSGALSSQVVLINLTITLALGRRTRKNHIIRASMI